MPFSRLAEEPTFQQRLVNFALQEEEDALVRYGAFILVSRLGTPEIHNLLSAHKPAFWNWFKLIIGNTALSSPCLSMLLNG